MKKLAVFSLFVMLSSCSNPFGSRPLVETIGDVINTIFGKTTTEMVSGGTQNFVTNGNYKVSATVGSYTNQNTVTTAGGYKVMMSIKNQ